MSHKLTEGALTRICAQEEVQNPTVQVLGHKDINQGSAQERFRLLLSDGKYSNSFCFLATHHNERLHNKELEMFTFLKLTKIILNKSENPSQNKRVIIVREFDVVAPGAEVGYKIGSPIAMASDGSAPNKQKTNPNAAAANNENANPNAGTAPKRPAGPVGGQPPIKRTPAYYQPQQRSFKEQDDIEKIEAVEASFKEALKLRENQIQANIASTEQLLKETQNTLDKQKQLEAVEASFREASKLRENQVHAKIASTEQLLKDILDEQNLLKAVEASFRKASKMRENHLQVEISGTEKLLQEAKNTLDKLKQQLEGHKAMSEPELTEMQMKKEDVKTMMGQRGDGNDSLCHLVPECPVCFERMIPPIQIYTCGNGHVICSFCKEKFKETGNMCINNCRAVYAGRATAMEQMIRQIFGTM